MRKQSEAVWLEQWFDQWDARYGLNLLTNTAKTKRLLVALKRRGWKPPNKGKVKR